MKSSMSLLKNALYKAVSESTNDSQNFVIAFSGGIDSALLSQICLDLGKKISLLTIGFPNSHDLEFSKHIASKFAIPHIVEEIDIDRFRQAILDIKVKIQCNNTSHIENCIAFHFIAELANRNKFRYVLSANGCDELFCGYDRYREIYGQGSDKIMKFMDERLENEFKLMEEINLISSEFGVQTRQPFLSKEFIKYAKTIPVDLKIKGKDDKIRKHILREVAISIGVPKESALSPKKALQYGSLIHKNFKMYRKQYM
jgi:asparagine synthase (glutamine-hydrolysing)